MPARPRARKHARARATATAGTEDGAHQPIERIGLHEHLADLVCLAWIERPIAHGDHATRDEAPCADARDHLGRARPAGRDVEDRHVVEARRREGDGLVRRGRRRHAAAAVRQEERGGAPEHGLFVEEEDRHGRGHGTTPASLTAAVERPRRRIATHVPAEACEKPRRSVPNSPPRPGNVSGLTNPRGAKLDLVGASCAAVRSARGRRHVRRDVVSSRRAGGRGKKGDHRALPR
ncbi:Hypothetical protein A7982_10995 [Minicystis rosea]|nr:Hypothetical protein A7982_10995 [Minicystis rosea]